MVMHARGLRQPSKLIPSRLHSMETGINMISNDLVARSHSGFDERRTTMLQKIIMAAAIAMTIITVAPAFVGTSFAATESGYGGWGTLW
jgi:hypothetical protein